MLMKQRRLGLSYAVRRTRECEFLDAMELIAFWSALVVLRIYP